MSEVAKEADSMQESHNPSTPAQLKKTPDSQNSSAQIPSIKVEKMEAGTKEEKEVEIITVDVDQVISRLRSIV